MRGQRPGHLSRIVIKGFKSIKDCDLELQNINVLIGSNGAGKSNFVSAFTLLKSILKHELNLYASKKGISNLFYNGLKATDNIQMEFWFGEESYSFDLLATENNSLVFCNERFSHGAEGRNYEAHSETKWGSSIPDNIPEPFGNMNDILQSYNLGVYHFYDTGSTSRIKTEHNLSNCEVLLPDARNLAAFLRRLRDNHIQNYNKILKAIQRIAPYFKDFELYPQKQNKEHIVLHWRENGRDDIYNASQLSDGTLRFICLVTLLLQPTELQPATIIIDEPELGLHPYAITIFAELVKKVAARKQIILATQSAELLDHFEPEDVIVVDRSENGSVFKRLDAEQLAVWLEDDYSLGDLWNKNIFGGR